jgi:hypothetical protein
MHTSELSNSSEIPSRGPWDHSKCAMDVDNSDSEETPVTEGNVQMEGKGRPKQLYRPLPNPADHSNVQPSDSSNRFKSSSCTPSKGSECPMDVDNRESEEMSGNKKKVQRVGIGRPVQLYRPLPRAARGPDTYVQTVSSSRTGQSIKGFGKQLPCI